MTAADFEPFTAAWLTLAELYSREPTEPGMKLAFSLLADYELGEVTAAMREHARRSRFMATPAELIELIRGVLPSDAVLKGLGCANDTPLGWKVRSLCGVSSLGQMDDWQATERVKSVRPKVEAFFERAKLGDFTQHEMRCMLDADIDPAGDLCHGLPGPRAPFREATEAKVLAVEQQQLLEAKVPEREQTIQTREEGRAALASILSQLNGAAPYRRLDDDGRSA